MTNTLTETAARARGIAFSPMMLAAIHAGQKTQTRRIVKPQPPAEAPHRRTIEHWKGGVGALFTDREPLNGSTGVTVWCPYGKPGDRLWVKEALYRDADGFVSYASDDALALDSEHPSPPMLWPWKPSKLAAMYMPRRLSRLTLEISGVRVERLQSISDADAIAEGISAGFQMNAGWPDFRSIVNGVCTLTQDCPVASYRTLWESINGKGSWATNPWVWALTFRVLPSA